MLRDRISYQDRPIAEDRRPHKTRGSLSGSTETSRRWQSRQELRLEIVIWIERTYHRRRRQRRLGRLTIEFEITHRPLTRPDNPKQDESTESTSVSDALGAGRVSTRTHHRQHPRRPRLTPEQAAHAQKSPDQRSTAISIDRPPQSTQTTIANPHAARTHRAHARRRHPGTSTNSSASPQPTSQPSRAPWPSCPPVCVAPLRHWLWSKAQTSASERT
ncbi:hypothetical protein ABMA10_19430 [Plantibacter sp. RU18]